jgi:hypothetical protein
VNTELHHYRVADLVEGFIYNDQEDQGLYALAGNLTIDPAFQRNCAYADNKREIAVIDSALRGYPLGLCYFNQSPNGRLEVLDGRQRISSLCRFVTGQFALVSNEGAPTYFVDLPADAKQRLLSTELLVYVCSDADATVLPWLSTLSHHFSRTNDQELLNILYSGPFVDRARAEFANTKSPEAAKRSIYVAGAIDYQDFLACALDWVSRGDVAGYMAAHRYDTDIDELLSYFNAVLDWVSSVFKEPFRDMRGLPWGEFYEKYAKNSYSARRATKRVNELYSDPYVTNPIGIFEYILGGETDPRLLDLRVFDDRTRRLAYHRQTTKAKALGISNCPACARDGGENQAKIWWLYDLNGDHVGVWSRGETPSVDNCEMFCRAHNKARGNR